jgi:transcriptional regulator with XRE-family HTH domain
VDSGQILKESRLRAGLTQRRLAELAGLTQPTVARIESGVIQPTFERVVELVRACGLDLDIRVVPLDEDAWTVARRGLELTPDERLDRAVAAVDLMREAGELREGNDG